jgi:nitrate reductase beta subunit
MSEVYNWHLGRPMNYRFESGATQRQFAAVFNINRCIACQTCTMACKSTWTHSPGQELMWWNNVETKPYGSYPNGWDVKALGLLEDANPGGQVWDGAPGDARAPYGRFDGVTVFEATDGFTDHVAGYLPADEEWKAPNRFEDHATRVPAGGAALPEHLGWFFYLARICNHCSYPACLASCPRNAIYKRPEDGIVLVDQARCRGYRKCVEACPYKKAMYRPTTRTTEKCVGCYPRVEGRDPLTDGSPMEPRCMSACVGKIRLNGLVEVEEDGTWADHPDHPLNFLVQKEQVALPLYPQFGTQPNVYYIPPRWVPRDYLRQMFGPGVDLAIERYERPSRELLAVLQLFRVTQEMIFRFDIEEGPKVSEITVGGRSLEVFNDTVVGFDESGREVARVQVEEPTFERTDKLNSI